MVNEMMNELERFYKTVINYQKYNNLLNNTNGIYWINIYDENLIDSYIGVSQDGKWVLKQGQKVIILDNEKKFLFCSNMLEIPYQKIKTGLEERFSDIIQTENINIVSIFPFYQLIKFGFNNLFDDYWFDLSIQWYEELELPMKNELKDALKNILLVKKISQKNRQRAKREIKKLELAK